MLDSLDRLINGQRSLRALEPEPATAAHSPGGVALGIAVERPAGQATRAHARSYRLRGPLVATDVLAVNVAFLIADALGGMAAAADVAHMLIVAAGSALWLLFAHFHGLYRLDGWRSDYDTADELGRLFPVATLWCWSLLVSGWVVGVVGTIEIGPLAGFWVTAIAMLAAGRAAVRAWARRRVWYWQNALIIAGPRAAEPLVQRIARNPRFGINVVAAVDPGRRSRFVPAERRYIGHVPVVGESPSVPEMVETFGVDRVIIAGPLDAEYERSVVYDMADLGVHVDFMPTWSEALGAKLDVHALGGMPLLTAPGTELRRSALVAKRIVDLVVGGLALVALAPLLAACAIAIKLDSPGPVLFRQRRVGKDERRFDVIKFRSMYEDAEARKAEVADLNFHGGGTGRGMFKIRQDPRITRVGAFLRRYSLDELPQFVNVVRGEMSLVGPRPLIENEHRQIEDSFLRRASLKPGVTGIWQVHGRSEVPFDEMVSLDCLYVRSWSLAGDLKILIRTLVAVVRGRGAY